MAFADTYAGRRVLVTGHTGFKGSWLVTWLMTLGAEVTGVSLPAPTVPSMFEELSLAKRIRHHQADIRDLSAVSEIVEAERPEFVFHLAAQAIVSASYRDPVETVTTNVVGTTNVLEALRGLAGRCTAVFVTSDKSYDNLGWVWGYRETDALGGKDVYSGSKGAAELIIKSYLHSFFGNQGPVRLAVARAGNVVGGGDWAADRLVADCARAWSEGRAVVLRRPQATRPWQHVLDSLSGYLRLGQVLNDQASLHGEAFNFGPSSEQRVTVAELLRDLSQRWKPDGLERAYEVAQDASFDEARFLALNCDKALSHLGWEGNLSYDETVGLVADWYTSYYGGSSDMYKLTTSQISRYESIGLERARTWART